MGRLKVIVLILLSLAVPVGAAEISMRLDSLGLNVYQHLYINTAGNTRIPDSVRNTAINEAIQQVCQDFPAIEKLDTIVLAKATKGVALNSDFLRANWAVKFGTVDGDPAMIPLQYIPVAALFDIHGKLQGAEQDYNNEASPRYFFTFGDRMFFYPQPWSADTVIVAYYAMDTLLQAAASVSQVLPQYRDAIISMACYKLAVIQERFTVAQVYMQRYGELLGLARSTPEKKVE